jgi:hypothetical protein
MWNLLVLLFGMLFHTRSGQHKRKVNRNRKFYRHGYMREEVDALSALNEGIEMEQHDEQQHKS